MSTTNEVNKSTDSEKFLKRLLELSLKTIGEIPILEDPSFEQKQFFIRKMKKGKFT